MRERWISIPGIQKMRNTSVAEKEPLSSTSNPNPNNPPHLLTPLHPTPPRNAQSSFGSQSVCLSPAMPDAKQKWRRARIFGERTHPATINPRHSIRMPSQYPIPISTNSSHPSIAVRLPLARTIFGVWFGFGVWLLVGRGGGCGFGGLDSVLVLRWGFGGCVYGLGGCDGGVGRMVRGMEFEGVGGRGWW